MTTERFTPGRFTPSVVVGNDVVDLSNPRTEGRATDDRFVGRVYAPEEQKEIAASAEGDLELWSRWAAKETGFKVISKLIGEPPPFVHRAFRVAWGPPAKVEPTAEADIVRRGSVVYERPGQEGEASLRAEVWVSLLGDALHGVGYAWRGQAHAAPPSVTPRVALVDAPDAAWAGTLGRLSLRFTDRELDAVYSKPSAAVRLGARKELAERLDVVEARVEIVCAPGPTSQRPPRVLLDGERTEADVSLSHDGRWIAWAIWIGQGRDKD